jgi:hypothetical protein
MQRKLEEDTVLEKEIGEKSGPLMEVIGEAIAGPVLV